MNIICDYCQAKRLANESSNCCHNGKVQVTPISQYPQELYTLLTGNNTRSKNFRENIRQYNSAMAFASLGAKFATPPGRGPYVFRIHGQIYHLTGSLYPAPGNAPKYSQLYILEGDQAVEKRMMNRENINCQRDIMVLLTTILDRINPYAAAYKHLKEVEDRYNSHAAENNNTPPTVTMHFKRGNDQRRYNEPRHDEVAAVFISSDGAPPPERDIVVHPRDEPPRNISYRSANADPMVYPLFFPRGDLGWCPGMSHTPEHSTQKRNTITVLQFYAHRLAVRQEFSPLFYGAKLFQQYIVDAYVRTEASRLDFIRKNQSGLRVELYQGLMDHISSQAADANLTPGKIVILPSSFQGSPRAMQQNYQDAMAIVSKYGKPDLFITFTCNPKCKCIVDNLPEGQSPEHRPDVVARVFKQQVKELLHELTVKHVLGVPVAHVHVVEFQKRGLPHVHMLIILSPETKLREVDDIDSTISAEIPDPETQPQLHAIVKRSMVHGPCGVLNKHSVCMVDGSCTKDYPKEFCETTVMLDHGYPLYKRRDNGRTIAIGPYEVDNRWIVPYNPYLSQKFNAHINVEACTSIKSVKYLFKYVYKGHDCANIEMTATNELNHDEVSTFLDARYVSAPEAFWRLSEYDLHNKSHTIIRLPIHLPDHQPVYFQPGQHEQAVQSAANQNTMLTAYFAMNSHYHTNYTYSETPLHFVFNKSQKKWQPRKRGSPKIITRMYSVSPKDMERYCLRLLLLHVAGATSFEDLRTFNGYVAPTFKEACILHNLLQDDTEWLRTMEEASAVQMPGQIRSLFATICTFCDPSDPVELWNRFKPDMIEDFVHHRQLTQETAERLALGDIDMILQQHGQSCSSLGLPVVDVAASGQDD